MDEIVVLGHNVGSWTGEVEGICFFGATEIVKFEFQVIWKFFFVAPDNPSDTRIHKTILVSGSAHVLAQFNRIEAELKDREDTH